MSDSCPGGRGRHVTRVLQHFTFIFFSIYFVAFTYVFFLHKWVSPIILKEMQVDLPLCNGGVPK